MAYFNPDSRKNFNFSGQELEEACFCKNPYGSEVVLTWSTGAKAALLTALVTLILIVSIYAILVSYYGPDVIQGLNAFGTVLFPLPGLVYWGAVGTVCVVPFMALVAWWVKKINEKYQVTGQDIFIPTIPPSITHLTPSVLPSSTIQPQATPTSITSPPLEITRPHLPEPLTERQKILSDVMKSLPNREDFRDLDTFDALEKALAQEEKLANFVYIGCVYENIPLLNALEKAASDLVTSYLNKNAYQLFYPAYGLETLKWLYARAGSKLEDYAFDYAFHHSAEKETSKAIPMMEWLIQTGKMSPRGYDKALSSAARSQRPDNMAWLIKNCLKSIPDEDFAEAFKHIAQWETDSFKWLQWLYQIARDKVKTNKFAFNQAFQWTKISAESLTQLQWLWKIGHDVIEPESFGSMITTASSCLEGLPTVNWLLEIAQDKIQKSNYIIALQQLGRYESDFSLMKQIIWIQCLDQMTAADYGACLRAVVSQEKLTQKTFDMMKWLFKCSGGNIDLEFCEEALTRLASDNGTQPDMAITMIEYLMQRIKFSDIGIHKAIARAAHNSKILEWFWSNKRQYFIPDVFGAIFCAGCSKMGEQGVTILAWAWQKGHRVISNDNIQLGLEIATHKNFLPLIEWVFNHVSDRLSPFMINWIFLKCVASGEQGISLMERVLSTKTKQLSYPILLKAWFIATNKSHVQLVAIIEKTIRALYGTQVRVQPLTTDDLHLLLKSSHYPSGYRPLGDAPQRYGWKPLSQQELNSMCPDSAVKEESEDPFTGSDVKIVEDGASQLAVHEIHASEAHLFRQLYKRIKLDKTKIKIFQQSHILNYVRQAMTRPSGRWILLFACRLNSDIKIAITNDECKGEHWDNEHQTLYMSPNNPSTHYYKNKNGEITEYKASKTSLFLHELLHALQDAKYGPFTKILIDSQPSEPAYDNLHEQLTIAGVDEDLQDLFEELALTENTFNYEMGFVKRFGHQGSIPQARRYREMASQKPIDPLF